MEIINGSKIITDENFPSFTETFECELLFCKMYHFLKMHKEVSCNNDIPNSSCLCEVYENASLLAKEINSSLKSSDILSPTAHNLVKTHTWKFGFKGLYAWVLSGMFKAGTIVI